MPDTKIFTSLTLFIVINASVPIKAELTFDLIKDEASFKFKPATTILPISGMFTEPSPPT